MSPASSPRASLPAAASLVDRVATMLGQTVFEERRRRQWSAKDLAQRARVSRATVTNVEAGRRASLDVYARLAVALGTTLDISMGNRRRSGARDGTDLVHAAMGDLEAGWLTSLGYHVAIDQPYQHYQFAGRADVLAWTDGPSALLHLENRTRFPDLQQAAGSYNAKRQYLAGVVASHNGIRKFRSETHVMVGLWSAEILHRLRLHDSSFRALCPDSSLRFDAWLAGTPPPDGRSSSFVLLDPLARARQAITTDLEHALASAKPRVRGYREAAEQLRARHRG